MGYVLLVESRTPRSSKLIVLAPPSRTGPETVDHSLIGTTRRINPRTGMIEWTRLQSNNVKSGESAKESVIFRVDPLREASKLVFQLGTSDPARAVAAARLVAGDVAGIDVNAGCPKPFSTSGGMGAALLRTPDRLVAILEALVGAVGKSSALEEDTSPPSSSVDSVGSIGVSVKIRLLETAAETESLVRRLVATGITGLTVHCRTTPMRPRERAIRDQLRMIANVCREAGVACLMNGDVEGRDQARKLVEEFGVDGAMIATAAEKNPSCFRAEADGGLAPWLEIAEKCFEYAMEAENKFGNTKHLLSQMIPGKHWKSVAHCKSYTEFCEVLGFERLLDMAKKTDALLGTCVLQAGGSPKKRKRADDQTVPVMKKQSKSVASNPVHKKKQAQSKDQAFIAFL